MLGGLFVAAVLSVSGCRSQERHHGSLPSAPEPAYRRIEVHGIHNAFRVTDRVYSGSQPDDAGAFAALAKLGVKTIISVDGSRPDVETAHRFGLRYIHLPIGYDGVSNQRAVELAKAVGSQTEPVFVHCHHGLHRGPAAVAVICEATENWTPDQAQTWMRTAGTASEYAGLYRSAANFRKPTPAELAKVKTLPEVSKATSLVEAMVRIDEHFSRLKLCQKAGWLTPPDHADLTPAHEATLLWEEFRELSRTPDTASRTEPYRAVAATAERTSETLSQALKAGGASAGTLDEALAKIGPTCASCHKQFRNP